MAVTDRKPRGLLRVLLRAPIYLYRAGLGFLAGHRFVYLAHRGRRTGARREVVVEVVRYDPDIPEVVVVAAWGRNPDWYRNIQAAPAIEVRLSRHRWPRPEHRYLDAAEVRRVLLAYSRAHPSAWKRLAPLLGFPADPADTRWPEVAAGTRAIAFRPRS
ncbi:deazaflavin-dependent oxidoreductase, nitroreductase family [Saccharopolyspora kobensis]|uniref:Deazaflavin-dependent oxidoreductase, nitroreductase family n=1 Tax=Saccharopolyspora kobensis TaxID=146035 RepID=A0A1H5SXE3_9PSEU|nr:nitroreductase family deazaflavin-dependent oxidoreductase [Saccharopolyspora kobensis]SEF55189.1 deazaflavin-dependent oxidoreductase, nitroreductase family [Saccharopolyspora kobensis]SFC52721.1 deazaflavin-dependent oxidoreductase, nitroreductase family [Saccharopolyspora kobensis]